MPEEPSGLRHAMREPQTVVAFSVGVLVLLFFIAKAPDRPGIASERPHATPFPTITAGPSPTFGPSPTPGPATPTATPEAGGPERDQTRRRDLIVIAGLLDAYFADNGAFPKTGGNPQSLCVYQELDAGCGLMEYASDGEIPKNPKGEPYQYLSEDGTAWAVFAELETSLADGQRCEHPAAANFPNRERLICITGARP